MSITHSVTKQEMGIRSVSSTIVGKTRDNLGNVSLILLIVSLGFSGWALKQGLKERHQAEGRPELNGGALPKVSPLDHNS